MGVNIGFQFGPFQSDFPWDIYEQGERAKILIFCKPHEVSSFPQNHRLQKIMKPSMTRT